MHLVAELADALLDQRVRILLVAQHHLHEVELALHQATCADSGVDVRYFTRLNTIIDGLKSLGQIPILLTGGPRGSVVGLESGHCLERTLHLVIEDATLLVNLDDGRAGVVVDHAALLVVVPRALLLQSTIPRVFLRQGVLVADRDVRVDDGVRSGHSHHAAGVVCLRDAIELETAGLSFVISILDSIILLVAIEDALAHGRWVDLAGARHRLVVSLALVLQHLHLANGVSVTICLTVDVAEGLCLHRGVYQCAYGHEGA
mmetsp:Transcript_11455/g.15445  ORF Transcript_11455/g.15445 Transcript_11455/m.15445 type:complete len:260 (-) Transcript_11455:430-1209(-)